MRLPPLESAEVIRREKRFRLFIKYDGKEVLSYLPNPGRLENIIYPSSVVYISKKEGEKRKTSFEAVLGEENGILVSLNASLANRIFEENLFRFPVKVKELRKEFTYHGKRFDFLINNKILVEIKSVTLVKDHIGFFPDAPTTRGAKHLEYMADWIFEKWVIFVVQREDAKLVKPNKDLDKDFYQSAKLLKERGGIFFAFTCNIDLKEIRFKEFIDVEV
jgi:sugar fermentation stimulation protein A